MRNPRPGASLLGSDGMAGKIQKQEACSEALPNYTDHLSFRERGLAGPRSSLTGHLQIELLQEECLGVFWGVCKSKQDLTNVFGQSWEIRCAWNMGCGISLICRN